LVCQSFSDLRGRTTLVRLNFADGDDGAANPSCQFIAGQPQGDAPQLEPLTK